MAKNDAKKGKDKTKGSKKKSPKQSGGASDGISIASHPRAAAAVKRAKGFGGVGGFAVAAYVSYKAGVPADQVGLRALAVGIVGYMLAWACAVTVWRQLVLAEMRAAIETGRATLDPPLPQKAAPPTPADEPEPPDAEGPGEGE